jgi:hypothetical protein
VFDPGAIDSRSDSGRGVRVIEYPFSSQSVSRLATNLLQLIRAHRLALPNDAELLDELANVACGRRAGRACTTTIPTSTTTALCLALAAFELAERRGRRPSANTARCGSFPCVGE